MKGVNHLAPSSADYTSDIINYFVKGLPLFPLRDVMFLPCSYVLLMHHDFYNARNDFNLAHHYNIVSMKQLPHNYSRYVVTMIKSKVATVRIFNVFLICQNYSLFPYFLL